MAEWFYRATLFDDMWNAILIKPPEKVLDSNNPWRDDELDRQKYVQPLLNLIMAEKEPITVAFDGAWGSGKTFFLQRFRYDLETAGAQALYFSAWESDFVADPLVAIIGQLQRHLHYKREFKTEVKRLKKSAVKYLDAVAEQCSGVISHCTGLDLWGATKQLRSAIRSSIVEYDRTQSIKSTLAQRLQNLARISKSGPIVCIIDEIDRCRPTFAIETIERIKHLFCVQNIVFVIGVDKTQLSQSIKAVYGDIDTGNYLRRFFNCTFHLPPPKLDGFLRNRLASCHALSISAITPCVERFISFFSALATAHQFALREIEDSATMFSIILKASMENLKDAPELMAVMIVLRTRNFQLYSRFIASESNPKEVLEFLWTEHPESWPDKEIMQQVAYVTYAAFGNGHSLVPELPDFLGWLDLSKKISEEDIRRRFPCPRILYEGWFKRELYDALIGMQQNLSVSASKALVSEIGRLLDCFS